jgi:hypothetical protein
VTNNAELFAAGGVLGALHGHEMFRELEPLYDEHGNYTSTIYFRWAGGPSMKLTVELVDPPRIGTEQR